MGAPDNQPGPTRCVTNHRGGWLIGYLFFAVMVATGLPTPLYPLYKERLGLSSFDITAVYGVYAVTVLIVLLVAGSLSDRVGRRSVLIIAVTTAAGAEAVLLASPSLPGLYAGRAMTGLSTGLVLGSATAYLTELAGPGRGRSAAALAVVANFGGQAVGTALAGVCARFLPHPVLTPYLVGLALLAPVALLARWVPETVEPTGRWRDGVRLQALRVPRAVRAEFWQAATTLFAAFSLLGFLTALTGQILAESTGHPGGLVAGLVTAGLFASAALSQLIVQERLYSRAGAVSLAALPLCAVLLAAANHAGSLLMLLIAVLMTGAVVGVTLRAGIGRVMGLCPPDHRGKVSSALFVAVYGGASLPTIAAGLIATLVSLTAAVLSLGAFVIALAAAAAIVSVMAPSTASASRAP